jgi:hypothetical protein
MDTTVASLSFDETIIPLPADVSLSADLPSDTGETLFYPLSTLSEIVRQDRMEVQQQLDDLLAEAESLHKIIEEANVDLHVHPWEKFSAECIDPNTPPLTLDEISIMPDFSVSKCVTHFEKIGDNINELADIHLSSVENENISNENIGNMFAVLSGDRFIVDRTKASNFIQFTDLLRNLPLDTIESNSLEIAQKVLSHYIKIHE